MSSGQSLRNGSSVEPGLPNTFVMPNARSRSKVACLTVIAFADLTDKAFPRDEYCFCLLVFARHSGARATRENPGSRAYILFPYLEVPGSMLRIAPERRRYYQLAVAFMVGCPSAFAVHSSSPSPAGLA